MPPWLKFRKFQTLAQCTLNISASKTFKRNLATLEKKYRRIREDLQLAIAGIEADHEENAFYPVALRTFRRRVWKYSFGSSDLRRHPRECFRLICTFVDESPSERPVLYAILCFWKGDQEDASNIEIKNTIAALVVQMRETATEGEQA